MRPEEYDLRGPSRRFAGDPAGYDLRQPGRSFRADPSAYESRQPNIVSGIVQTANALGMDPVDLATIISYETGGTFDPTQAGPTTQWGRHRGLIQFGEPQARQYGVDWNDPVGSQLGPDGAIVRYFRNAGWQPGMGMLDAYSAVNAGRVGRYNASDANNGGAPGTVRDKVQNQMSAHRAKAAALLGMGEAPGNALAGYNAPPPSYDMPQQQEPQQPRLDWRTAMVEPAQMQGYNALAPQYDTRPRLGKGLF